MSVSQQVLIGPKLAAQWTSSHRAGRKLGALTTCSERGNACFMCGREGVADIGATTGLPLDIKVHTRLLRLTAGARKKDSHREEFSQALLTLRN